MPAVGRLSWSELASQLSHQEEIRLWMHDHWRNLPLSDLDARAVAHLCLLREFMRRPKRQNSLETLGLAALEYPKLESTAQPPAPWKQRSLPENAWRDFLKVCVDFTVRAYTAIDVEVAFINWMGAPVRPKLLVGPDADLTSGKQIRWPTVNPRNHRNRLIQLLARVLRGNPADRTDAADIDTCLRAAWTQLTPLLSRRQEGLVLKLDEQAVIREGGDAWFCPVTRKVLDVTVQGLTPYLTPHLSDAAARCRPVRLPRLPDGFWRREGGGRYTAEEIDHWIRGNEEIRALEDLGAWSDISTRIAAQTSYFQVGEHSAQQSPTRLQELESEFREGRVNLLSCSTTMELGVDIGGLSAVAMNNTPPSPANYLQRAGRAGRRKETRAFSFTLCKNTPQGEWSFRTPLWPFTTPTHVPDVTLNSERIVQRHVNSLALTRFFKITPSDAELRKLHAGAFFESSVEHQSSVCERFEEWLGTAASEDDWLTSGIRKLLRRSIGEERDPQRVLGTAAEMIQRVREAWTAELEPLQRELELLGADQKDAIPRKAIEYRLIRIREEYLLKELAVRNFLPGYGFPTSVVPFVTTTAEDLQRKQRRANGKARIDNLSLMQGYPSRELTLALRDYAPGTTVVVDGRVLESRGLTLNWKIPSADSHEVQSLKWAWRCLRCGNTDVSSSWPSGCTSEICQGSDAHLEREKFLQPAGFTVAISATATNDLTRNSYLPVEDPWISTGREPWQSLPRPELGQYRYSGQGQIFAFTRGRYGNGYAVCLRCGMADSEDANPRDLPDALERHYPLRGGSDRDQEGRCRGNDHSWSVLRGTWLGASRETDVFELQLRYAESGTVVVSDKAASSIAVALRQALAERIGIEDREIGWACLPARDPQTGVQTRSIVLYDTANGGAGFVSQAVGSLPSLLRRAFRILSCPRNCDAACHACLLSSDTWHSVQRLNRHDALAVLTKAFRDGLELPDEARIFGEETYAEFEPLALALNRELRRPSMNTVRLVLAGNPQEWELEEWLLESRLGRWMSDKIRVEFLVPAGILSRLDAPSRNRLAAWSDAGLATIVEADPSQCVVGTGALIAEVGGPDGRTRFAVLSPDHLTPGSEWGIGSSTAQVLRTQDSDDLVPLTALGTVRDGSALRCSPAGTAAAIAVTGELNGGIDGVGQRFWTLVLQAAPRLMERLQSGAPIDEVVYQDRYVRTPLAMRAVLEVMKALRAIAKPGMAGSRVRLSTVPVDGRAHEQRWVWNDWDLGADRYRIFAAAAAGAGLMGELFSVPKPQSPHARELSIRWKDGASWRMRLDEGFGFLRCAAKARHDFSADAERQGAAMLSAQYDVECRRETHLYLLHVEEGEQDPSMATASPG